MGGRVVAGVPGAGDVEGCHPAGAQQAAQHAADRDRCGPAGGRVAQPRQPPWIDDVQVDVHMQLPRGQHADQLVQAGLADRRAGQVLGLGGI